MLRKGHGGLYKAPTKAERRKRKAKRRARSDQVLLILDPLPHNRTKVLHLFDLTVNSSCKAFHRSDSQNWFAEQVQQQIQINRETEQVKLDYKISISHHFFSSSDLLSIYKSQIRPSLEYCSHVWGGAPKTTLCLLDKIQSKAIRLTNNPNLTKSLQPLSHRRLVGDLSIFYRYFNGHCSQEIRDIIPVPLRRVRTTRSSTHSHPFQVSLPTSRTLSHKSSFIPRTCNLWNVLPSSCFPESYNVPSFKSNVNKLDLISLSS